MNKFFLYFILILLNSCSTFQSSGYSELFGTLKNYALNSDTVLTDQFIIDFPYSFAMVKIGRSPSIRMVLLSVDKNIYEWVSSDRIKIFTKRGKIVKTIGLEFDIDFQNISLKKEIFSSQTFKVNFFNPKLYNVTVKSDFEIIKSQIKESSSYSEINWNVTNHYVLKDGKVSESIQRIHPHFPEIKIQFFLK
jgi:hypothetical protein